MTDAIGRDLASEVQDIYPLTPLQEGMLFHSLREPGTGMYCVQSVWEFHGSITEDAVRAAWQDVARAHPVLRTAFSWRHGGRQVQVVLQNADVPVFSEDWRSLDTGVRKSRWEQLLVDDRGNDFDLSRAPLMRLWLIAWTPGYFRLVWTCHHILLDGWSWSIVSRDFLRALEMRLQSRKPVIQTPRPFRDYVDWLGNQDLPGAKEKWREELAGMAGPTYLVTRPENNSGSSAAMLPEVRLSWGEVEHSHLRDYAKRERVTLSTLIQFAWAQVLAQYTRETDVVFGATTVNRPSDLQNVDQVAGLFINTLPVRLRDVSVGAVPAESLRTFQRKQAALRRQAFVSLTDISRIDGAGAQDGLFNSIMVFENYPDQEQLRSFGDQFEIVDYQIYDKTNYPLTLVVLPGDTFEVRASYNPQYHNREDVDALLKSLKRSSLSLTGVVQPLAQADLETKTCAKDPASDQAARSIHQRFRDLAQTMPEAAAVTFQGESITYGLLDRLSDRIACRLIESGVNPGELVGLCMGRSADTVAAILGILKAGAAYVPLDPDYPRDRILFSLNDCQCSSVITCAQDRSTIDESPAKIFLFDDLVKDVGENDAEVAATLSSVYAESDSLAYVIYTSGSTGNPKGVMVTHANVTRLFDATRHWFDFGSTDVWTLFHSFAFDFSVWELWGALLYGGRLVVVPHWTTRDVDKFHDLLKAEGVTVLNQTPSAFKQLIRVDSTKPVSDELQLRYVIFGGEALDFGALRHWVNRHGDSKPELINMYGITETTVHVTWHRVMEEDIEKPQGSVIGVPIPDLEIYLLDQDLNPVDPGAPGEIVVGGAGVAKGYLHRAELTEERFIIDPLDPKSGRRFYRSGDIGRRRSDGTLEYLGRIDDQIKIRGFRIEPGEVQYVLAAHGEVLEAVVLACEKESKELFLAAYYVLAGESATTSSDLKTWIAERLPAHMVPEAFVSLDEIPLTDNGKIDRKRLPLPGHQETRSGRAPKNDVERRLLPIWESLLECSNLGVEDNFFDVGGNSILSMQLAARLGKDFGMEVPVVTVYECPTIEKLAGHLSGETKTDDVRELARARAGRRVAPVRRPNLAKVTTDE